jgi:hypothetical protein
LAGGSDDFYNLKRVFNDCIKSRINTMAISVQEFLVSDLPGNCLEHVNLQDEDGSDHWLDVDFTITKERKL